MSEDLIGTQLGQYQLTEVVRRGGMATVYRAYQSSLDRYVAVKVLFHNQDPQFSARFKREARALAQLQHPNILPVYDYGEQDNVLFLVMQYIEGGATLSDLLGRPLAPAQALRLISRMLGALDYAHKRGIIHRDIKPANVLLPAPTWPMLADFGIARLINDTGQRLTVPGLIVGTAAYMAPEQATGRPIDGRTDLYATGVMLYEMVTGRVPFDADTPMAMLTMHAYEPPPPPRSLNPQLPTTVESVLLRAMAKDPGARFQSAETMADELGRVADQLEKPYATQQIASLYAAGTEAFEQGHWDRAVDELSRLVALDPDYEDAADLLEAAGAAQQRAREEARRQLELVRKRHQSTQHRQLHTPTSPVAVPTTSQANRLEAPPRPAEDATMVMPATEERTAGTPAATPTPRTEPSPSKVTPMAPPPAVPAPPPWRRYAIWGVLALVIAGIALVLSQVLGGTGTVSGNPTPIPGTGSDPTAAAPTAAAQPTSAPATRVPATSAPATAAPPTSAPATPVPPPEPLGELVYQDDFGDIQAAAARSSLEDDVEAPDFSRGFHSPGVYHFRLPNPNESHWVMLPRFAYDTFSVQVELWDNSDDYTGDVAQGLIFRARDNDHFYNILINPRKGEYTVRKLDGPDNWSDMIAWKPSPLILRQDGHNTLRIDAEGDTFTIYLNDALLDSFDDDDYEFGLVGMTVANTDAIEPHMHFDNINIWSPAPSPSETDLAAELDTPQGKMMLIPEGEFVIGGNDKSTEKPHIVALESFYIDQTEVTNATYRLCVEEGECEPPGDVSSSTHPSYFTDPPFDNFPVMHVTWFQAQNYCAWAGKRLPTEAEWEKAAGWDAGKNVKSIWPWDNIFDPARINSAESNLEDTTQAGQFGPELNGTMDMGGNLSEWTSSLYQDYPYDADDGREDPEAEGERVFRGGSWAQTQGKARVIYRQGAAPATEFREIGFRCAANP